MLATKTLVFSFLLSTLALSWQAVGRAPEKKKFNFPPLRDLKIPEVHSAELPQGMRALFLEDHRLPVVHFYVLIRGGDAYDPPSLIGLADTAMEVMRTGGIPGLTGDELDLKLDSMGAKIGTGSSTDATWLFATCLAKDVDQVLPIMLQVLRSPVFAQDKLELAKTTARSAISRRNDDPREAARREFSRQIYGPNSPFGSRQEYVHVDALTRNDLEDYHNRFIHPGNMLFGIFGDFDPVHIRQLLEKGLEGWKQGNPAPILPAVPPEQEPTIFLGSRPDVNQSTICLGHLGIRMDNPDYFAVEALNSILGTSGFLSRLMKVIRTEKGLTYGISGGVGAEMTFPGLTRITFSTRSESTVQALEAVKAELNRIRSELVTQDELELAKEAFLNSFIFRFESPRGLLAEIMSLRFRNYPDDFLEQLRAGFSAVTREDVMRVARQYIRPERMTIVVVGNPDQFDRPLESVGKVRTLDLTIPAQPLREESLPTATPGSIARGRAILARMLMTAGAEEKAESLESAHLVLVGEAQPAPGVKAAIRQDIWLAFPNRLQIRTEVPGGSFTSVLDGNKAWINTPQGVQSLSDSDRDELRAELDRHPLSILREATVEGNHPQHLGTKDFEGGICDEVYLPLERNRGLHVLVDQATGCLRMISALGRKGGTAGTIRLVFGPPNDLGGLHFPSSIEERFNDQTVFSGTFKSLELNPTIPPDIFQHPTVP